MLLLTAPDAVAQYYCWDLWPNPPATLAPGVVGQAYTDWITARNGGSCSGTFTVSGGLPPGITWYGTDVFLYFDGTPIQPGSYTFFVRFVCICGEQHSGWYTIDVGTCGSIVVDPPTLPPGTVGSAYAQTIAASGGTAPYTFALGSGTLPPGLSLSSLGLLDGTPSQSGSFTFEVTATDAGGCTGRRTYTVTVACATAITLGPPEVEEGSHGSRYTARLIATGGTPPYRFSITHGQLPAGLVLSSWGSVTGTPSQVADTVVTVEATDAAACTGSGIVRLVVRAAARIAAGLGQGLPNPPRLLVTDKSWSVTITAYAVPAWGIAAGAADLDGDLHDEIVTGPGPGATLGPHVRGFSRTGVLLPGLGFYAYGTLAYGVNPAGAQLDTDAFTEIVTGPGPGMPFGPHVRGWNVDGGAPRPLPAVSFHAYGSLHYGVRARAARVAPGGRDELLTVPGPGPTHAPHVRGFAVASGGTSAIAGLSFFAFPGYLLGGQLGAGDVDDEIGDEIAVAPGPGPALPASVRGFAWTGTAVVALPGFDRLLFATTYGARIALADHDDDRRANLLGAAGPDPAASSLLRSFSYDGASLVQDSWSLVAFPGSAYGLEVAAARIAP